MDILEKARVRRDSLQKQREQLMETVDRINAELGDLAQFFKIAERLQANSVVSGSTQMAPAWPHATDVAIKTLGALAQGNKSQMIARQAMEIIKQHGPQTARGVLKLMDENGLGELVSPDKDINARISYVSSVLSKDERFASDREKGGYVLVEQKQKDPQGQILEGPNSVDDLL
ncbi:hypothetical protein WJ74_02880 [Burkholderia ubonensis]|uniref:hypothetical protein n=1 Tax=Burkholderia ubonensis TaxID=101571 RepID=UPI000752CD1D|nr:hypothetical protein [Burkholderia ubonensis]KVO21398.1 hypothetical protein WJ74_02880 [Burkholderia ubonensis]